MLVYVSEAESDSSPSADASDDVSVPWSNVESVSDPPSVYVELLVTVTELPSAVSIWDD